MAPPRKWEWAALDDGTLGLRCVDTLPTACIMKKMPPCTSGWVYCPPADQDNPWFIVTSGEPIRPAWQHRKTPVLVHPSGLRIHVYISDLHSQHPPDPDQAEDYTLPEEYWWTSPDGRLSVAKYDWPKVDALEAFSPMLAPLCGVKGCRGFDWAGSGRCSWHTIKATEEPTWPDLTYRYVPANIVHPIQQALFGVMVTPPFSFLQEVEFTRRGENAAVRLEHICYMST